MDADQIDLPTIPLHPIVGIACLNLLFILLMILVFCSFLAKPTGFEIQIPRGISSDSLDNNQSINITAENVLYFNGKVVTFNELRKVLVKTNSKSQNILIYVDRRAMMGRVADVWELCRALNNSRVHIMTTGED